MLRPSLSKVSDMKEIMAYDVMSTPALVINVGKVMSSGHIPATADVASGWPPPDPAGTREAGHLGD